MSRLQFRFSEAMALARSAAFDLAACPRRKHLFVAARQVVSIFGSENYRPPGGGEMPRRILIGSPSVSLVAHNRRSTVGKDARYPSVTYIKGSFRIQPFC